MMTIVEPFATLNLEGDQVAQQHKSRLICVLTFLSRYPVSEDYFKRYACGLKDHWISIFHINGTWNHLKFLRVFQELENLSLGSWTSRHAEVSFKFMTNAQEFRDSTFSLDQQRNGALEAIQILATCIRNIPRASWSATTNSRLIGHINVCIDAEANLFGDTSKGIVKDPSSVKCLAQFYQEMGRYNDAEILYQLILGTDYDAEHDPCVQQFLEALGAVLDLQGRHAEAETVLRRALHSKIAMHGESDVKCLRVRENLANCLRNQGKFHEAEQHYLFLLEKHPTPWFSLKNNCALLHWVCGQLDDAQNIFTTLLVDCRSTNGDLHCDTLMARHNIGTLCLELGEHDDARTHLHDAFVGRKKVLGWIHPYTLLSARNLAMVEIELENYEKAERILNKALRMAGLHRPQEEDIHFDLMETIALLAIRQGHLEQTRLLLLDNFAKSAADRGSENPKTLQIAQALAYVFEAEGRVAMPNLRTTKLTVGWAKQN